MAWHLFGAKPLPDPMMTNCQLDPEQQTSLNFESDTIIFIQKILFEYI